MDALCIIVCSTHLSNNLSEKKQIGNHALGPLAPATGLTFLPEGYFYFNQTESLKKEMLWWHGSHSWLML